jgi:hypothetical protein
MTGQVFYKLANDEKGSKPEYMQHELLLVRKGSAAGGPGGAASSS